MPEGNECFTCVSVISLDSIVNVVKNITHKYF